jgi:hypothetical protein
MPYFYSKIIVSISKQGFGEAFKQNLVGYAAFALGFALFAAGRGALFGVINNKLSKALRWVWLCGSCLHGCLFACLPEWLGTLTNRATTLQSDKVRGCG